MNVRPGNYFDKEFPDSQIGKEEPEVRTPEDVGMFYHDSLRQMLEVWKLQFSYYASDRGKDNLPFEMENCGGRGGHEFYNTEPGPERSPAILLHGYFSNADSMEPIERALLDGDFSGDEVATVNFDLPYWKPSCLKDENALEQVNELVEKFLDYSGREESVLVGHSLGGKLSLQYADKYPDKVESVVSLGGAIDGSGINDVMRMLGLPHDSGLLKGSGIDVDWDRISSEVEVHEFYGGRDVAYPFEYSDPDPEIQIADSTHFFPEKNHWELRKDSEVVEKVEEILSR